MFDLDYEGNHPDGVRAICKECETVALKNTEAEAKEVMEKHNEQRHDGNDVAGLCAWDLQSLIPEEPSLEAIEALKPVLNDDDLTMEEKRKILGEVEPQ